MKVLILGAKGGLGRELVEIFTRHGYVVDGIGRCILDVTDHSAVKRYVCDKGYDAIINASAWNDVDGAEDPKNRSAVFAVNAEAPGFLATVARDEGIPFVHYSTDYVFSGEKNVSYIESDVPDPVSVYGESKSEGESSVRDAGGEWFVCRLSKLFGLPGLSQYAKPGFLEIMHRLSETKPELSIVDEEFGTPSYTRDVARATVRLLEEKYRSGFYHFVNEGPPVSWFGFADEYFQISGISIPRKRVPSSMFPKPAKRPAFAPLRNTKFPPLRSRHDALEEYAKDLSTMFFGKQKSSS